MNAALTATVKIYEAGSLIALIGSSATPSGGAVNYYGDIIITDSLSPTWLSQAIQSILVASRPRTAPRPPNIDHGESRVALYDALASAAPQADWPENAARVCIFEYSPGDYDVAALTEMDGRTVTINSSITALTNPSPDLLATTAMDLMDQLDHGKLL